MSNTPTCAAMMPRYVMALLFTLAAAACSRKAVGDTGADATAAAAGEQLTEVKPSVNLARTYDGKPADAVAGRELFLKYNCYACHGGLGGGAMGPSLRDNQWTYGGTDSLIYQTLTAGRPAGMPSFATLTTDNERHLLVQYILSLRSSVEPTFFFSPTDTTTHAGALN